MSRLAGFNFVFQLRREKLLDLIQERVTLAGSSLATPFRLSLPGPLTPGRPPRRLNTVDLIVKALDLALEVGTNFCTLTLLLEAGVIRLPGAPEVTFSGGAVSVRIELLQNLLLLARPLGATLHAPATAVITGIPDFAAQANTQINKLIMAQSQDFTLIAPDDPAALLFLLSGQNTNLNADTFCAHSGAGEINDLTPTVNPLNNPVSLAISAQVITSLMPAAETFSRDPVTITGLNVQFVEGFIDVNGTFDAEDDCWSIDGGTFWQRLSVAMVGGNFMFIPDRPTPHLSYQLDLDFFCLLAVEVLSILQIATVPIASVLGLTWAQFFLRQAARAATPPGTSVAPQPIPTIAQVIWTDLAVSAEGMLLLGNRGGQISPVQHPAIHIRTKNEPQNLHAVVQGSVTVQAPTCAAQAFDYVESIQDDRKTLTVDSEWLFEPIEYLWTVNGQPLTAHSELITIGAGDMFPLEYTGMVKVALPPPNGTTISGHSIRLLYRATGSTLLLSARNEDGNYDIRVEVRATDALGRVFSDAVNLTMVGDIAEFGPDYDDYMDRCIKAAADVVNRKGRQRTRLRPGEPQERWRDILETVTQQVREGNVVAAAMIPGLMKAVGIDVVGTALNGKFKV